MSDTEIDNIKQSYIDDIILLVNRSNGFIEVKFMPHSWMRPVGEAKIRIQKNGKVNTFIGLKKLNDFCAEEIVNIYKQCVIYERDYRTDK